jgi:hypothetical protein
MTAALRRENAQLRQANAALVAENMGYQRRWAKPPAASKPCWDRSPRSRAPKPMTSSQKTRTHNDSSGCDHHGPAYKLVCKEDEEAALRKAAALSTARCARSATPVKSRAPTVSP